MISIGIERIFSRCFFFISIVNLYNKTQTIKTFIPIYNNVSAVLFAQKFIIIIQYFRLRRTYLDSQARFADMKM